MNSAHLQVTLSEKIRAPLLAAIIVTLTTFSSLAFATSSKKVDACKQEVENVATLSPGSKGSHHRLVSVPFAANIITSFLSDARVSVAARSNVLRALEIDELSIIPMSTKLSQLNTNNSPAAAFPPSDYPFIVDEEDKPASYSKSDLVLRRADYRGAVVILSDYDDQPEARESTLIRYVVHELAHIRMYEFLKANAALLARSWPEYITPVAGGRYKIDRQFHAFLLEAHAWRLEFEVYESMLNNGYNVGFSKFGLTRNYPLNSYDKGCINCAVDSIFLSQKNIYGIENPRIVAMAGLPLISIVRGRGRVAGALISNRQKFHFIKALGTVEKLNQDDVDLAKVWFADRGASSELKAEILHALLLQKLDVKPLYSQLSWGERRKVRDYYQDRYYSFPVSVRLKSIF